MNSALVLAAQEPRKPRKPHQRLSEEELADLIRQLEPVRKGDGSVDEIATAMTCVRTPTGVSPGKRSRATTAADVPMGTSMYRSSTRTGQTPMVSELWPPYAASLTRRKLSGCGSSLRSTPRAARREQLPVSSTISRSRRLAQRGSGWSAAKRPSGSEVPSMPCSTTRSISGCTSGTAANG